MRSRSLFVVSSLVFFLFLSGVASPQGCDCGGLLPEGPDSGSDAGADSGPAAIRATLTMSIVPAGFPAPDSSLVPALVVDGQEVCANATTCEFELTQAKPYEVSATVTNGLCVPAILSPENGQSINRDIPCGLAPGYPEPQMYLDGGLNIDGTYREIEFYTQVKDNKVIMHGFLQDRDSVVNGNTFIMNYIYSTGNREVFEGTISDDLCQIIYHVWLYDASGNLGGENDHTLTSTDC